jgi:hypothetical protein
MSRIPKTPRLEFLVLVLLSTIDLQRALRDLIA